jgi:DNA-binding MarR family transcriptional regulator
MSRPAPAELLCICTTARMASRVLTRLYDDALRPFGLRTTQLSILSRLEDEGPLGLTQLAALLALERSTLTRDLAPLERRGLVRVATGEDRRQRVAELTADGRSTLEAAWPAWRAVQDDVRVRAGAERVERALADLRALAVL